MEISKEKLLEMYRNLVRARYLGDKLFELESTPGSHMHMLHRAIGEEAIPVAIAAVLQKGDFYKPSGVRMHPYLFVRPGFTMVDGIASECGRDLSKVGGHSTYITPELGVIGKSGILGEDGPMYVGAAASAQMSKSGKVVVYTCGDGTSNRAPVHESMAMAAAWNLPIIFVIQDNKYGMGTPRSKFIKVKDLSIRAAGYGFPGITVDGNDVITVYQTVKEYVDRARSGSGPGLIVAETYRLGGHYSGDPEVYRPKGEREEWWKKDPLPRYRKALLDKGILTDALISKIDTDAKAEVEAAGKAAMAVPAMSYEQHIKTAIDVL